MNRFLGSPRSSDGQRYRQIPDDQTNHSEEQQMSPESPGLQSNGNGRTLSFEMDQHNENVEESLEKTECSIDISGGNDVDGGKVEKNKEGEVEKEVESLPEKEEEEEPSKEAQVIGYKEDDGISVRILDLNGKYFQVSCGPVWTVRDMKATISSHLDIRQELQRLIYRGRVLEDDKLLIVDYNLEDGHTIHIFARQEVTPSVTADGGNVDFPSHGGGGSGATTTDENVNPFGYDDSSIAIRYNGAENMSPAIVFPSDGGRRIDPVMLDTPLGHSARRVKLWSSFFLIIYTMKVLSQFALMANMQAHQHSTAEKTRLRFSPYYSNNLFTSVVILLVHSFGVYVGCVGFKAAHDTDIRHVRGYCRGIVWLAVLTLIEQILTTIRIAYSKPEKQSATQSTSYYHGPPTPTLNDIVTANVLQAIILAIMWSMAIHHAFCHKHQVNSYNETLPIAVVNPAPNSESDSSTTNNTEQNSQSTDS